MAGGRPPKYKNKEELQEAIDKYFKSCYAPLEEGQDPDSYREALRPLTIGGLAVSIGMCRDSLLRYGKNDEFYDTIKKAKDIVHAWAEERLFAGGQVAGCIFNLKNNYGWVDKTEVDKNTTLKVVRKVYDEKEEEES